MKKLIGKPVTTNQAITELVTWENCELKEQVDYITLDSAEIINIGTADINVQINHGTIRPVKPNWGISCDYHVQSIKIHTNGAKVDWYGWL